MTDLDEQRVEQLMNEFSNGLQDLLRSIQGPDRGPERGETYTPRRAGAADLYEARGDEPTALRQPRSQWIAEAGAGTPYVSLVHLLQEAVKGTLTHLSLE